MILLGIDLETTGLDTEECKIIEVGAVLWNVERKHPILIYSVLVQDLEDPAVVSEEITKLTGIRQDDIDEFGVPIMDAMVTLWEMSDKAAAVVAHNGTQFDRPILSRYFKALAGFEAWDKEPRQKKLPWIDTKYDLPFPKEKKARRLKYMAADHGFLNPFEHRAIFDVMTMMNVLQNYRLPIVLERACSPILRLEAHVSYDTNQLAKDAGFMWKPDRWGKGWFREIKKCDLDAEEPGWKFSTTVVETIRGEQEMPS